MTPDEARRAARVLTDEELRALDERSEHLMFGAIHRIDVQSLLLTARTERARVSKLEAALRRIDDVIDRPCSVTEREVVEIARAALATDGERFNAELPRNSSEEQ